MKKLFIITVFFIGLKSFGQHTTAKQTDYIYKKGGHWRLDQHKLNGKDLKNELYKVPAAIPYYKKAKTSEIIGYSFIAPTVLFALLGKQNRVITNHGYGKNKFGFQIAGILSSGAIIFFLARSMKNLKKAAAIHNEKFRTVY